MALKKKNKRKKRNEIDEEDIIESDETFAYIAGYTSGGFAYGITWEEWEKIEKEEEERQKQLNEEFDITEDDLPF